MALAPPRSLHFDIHLGWEVHVHPGGGSQGKSDVKKKPDNWPEERQRPGRTSLHEWLNHLFTALLLTSRHTHTLSLWKTSLCRECKRAASWPNFAGRWIFPGLHGIFWNLELIDNLKSWNVFTSLEILEDEHHWGSHMMTTGNKLHVLPAPRLSLRLSAWSLQAFLFAALGSCLNSPLLL